MNYIANLAREAYRMVPLVVYTNKVKLTINNTKLNAFTVLHKNTPASLIT